MGTQVRHSESNKSDDSTQWGCRDATASNREIKTSSRKIFLSSPTCLTLAIWPAAASFHPSYVSDQRNERTVSRISSSKTQIHKKNLIVSVCSDRLNHPGFIMVIITTLPLFPNIKGGKCSSWLIKLLKRNELDVPLTDAHLLRCNDYVLLKLVPSSLSSLSDLTSLT